MRNFVQEGEVLDFIAPTGGVTAGLPLLIGAFFVVPETDAAEGLSFAGAVEGVFDLTAATHASTQAASPGDPAYFDAGTGKITVTASGNTLIGVFAEAKVSTVAIARVLLTPRLAAAVASIANLSLAAVTGVDGTGSNAASKADVDTRFASIATKVNAIIAALAAGGVTKAS